MQWTDADNLELEKSELARAMRPAALQAAAELVRQGLRHWCKENGYKRMPDSKEAERFIAELVAEKIEAVHLWYSEVAPNIISAKDENEVYRRARKK